MKKSVLIIALVISFLLIITSFILTSKIPSKDCSMIPSDKTETIQECCNYWAKSENIVLPFCVGEWVIRDGECSWGCTFIQPGPLHFCINPAGKTDKNKDELVQECCNKWAIENDVSYIKCVGKWVYNGGNECEYRCYEF
jgi:hypothetical protein